MKNQARKLFSSILLLTLILTQSSNLIYSIKASSEYMSENASDIASEDLVTVTSEVEDQEVTISEESVSDEVSTSEEGIISTVVNSFKSDKSLARATNGATTIEIVGYNEAEGMDTSVIYDVKVTADFGSDITSSGKTLEFTLPDGMTYKQIPVVSGQYNTSGINSSIVAQMGSDDPLATATSSITIPKVEAVTSSTHGTVKYEFLPGTKAVTVTFKVSADYQKILYPQTLPTQMTSTVSMSGSELSTVGQSIYVPTPERLINISRDDISLTSEILTSSATEEYIGSTSQYYFASTNNIAVKNAKIYIYYPKGAEFVDAVGALATAPTFTYEVDAANNVVIFTLTDDYVKLNGYIIKVTYKYPEGTPEGDYQAPAPYKIEYETYSGEARIQEAALIDGVTVLTDKVNEIDIRTTYSYNDDNTMNAIAQASVTMAVRNTKAYTIDNQIVEWSIDSTVKADVVTFPYDLSANNNQRVSKMMYKTHQDDVWVTATSAQLDAITYSNLAGTIELSDIGLSSTETLSDIRIWTGSYAADFYVSAYLGPLVNKSSVSVFADVIEPATSGNITYRQYDENNKTETEVTATRPLTSSEYLATQTATSASHLYFYVNGVNTRNVIAGDEVNVRGRINILSRISTTLQALKNPVIYIRETDEYKVDINNLKLTDYKGNSVDFTYEKNVGADGSVVYKVITSPNVEVGSFFNSDTNAFEQRTLSYSFDIITDPLATSGIDSNSLVLYGSNNYDITGLKYNDTYMNAVDAYDMDGDGSTTDTLLANIDLTLLVKPNTNIVVQSFFSKDGEDGTVEFINGDDSTAAVLEPGETYEYIATVINNAGESVDEFTAIIPVPKTGDNFGSFFQDEAFTWTMTLASLPTAPDGFEFYYSTDVTASTVLNGATWTKNPKNLDDVKMIKMVSTHTIVAGETVEVRVPYTIGETYDSTISGNKAGNVNAFKVAYEQKTSSYNGVLSGTWAGATYILAPEIELEDLNYIVGNSADLEEKVVATDFYGEQIDMTDITYDGSNVPVVDGLYSEVGTYQVEYTAVDRNGLTVTGTRLIKIDGLPEVEAEDQVYYITESDIEGQVDDSGVGYANRAGSEVGSALIREEIGTTYEILSYSETLTEESSEVGSETSSEVDSEVSSEEDSETTEVETLAFAAASETVVDQTFDKVGYYDVKYTAVDSFGQVAEKTVLVTVLDVEETPSEPIEEPSESKSDKLSDMTIADTGVNLVGTIIATLAILISLILIKRNLKVKN